MLVRSRPASSGLGDRVVSSSSAPRAVGAEHPFGTRRPPATARGGRSSTTVPGSRAPSGTSRRALVRASHRRGVGFPVAAAVFAIIAISVPAEAYKFLRRTVSSPTAARWAPADSPIPFRLLENSRLPTAYLTPESWRELVVRGFAHWTEISTATIAVHLEDEPFAADFVDADDGMNTIGFTGDEFWDDGYFVGNALSRIENGRIVGCDIRLSPWFFDRLDDRARENPQKEMERLAWLEMVVAHEVGHCLGLLHTDLNPTWEARPDTPAVVREGFYPEGVPAFHADPIMSYGGWHDLIGLTPDEITAVSLLYPTRQFLESTGAIGGRIVLADGRGAPGAYVQIAGGANPAGPHYGAGAFTDGYGNFLLEGLPPGRHLFWIHPLGDLISQLPPERREAAEVLEVLDIRDRWFWAEVRPGRVDIQPPVTVSSGRTSP